MRWESSPRTFSKALRGKAPASAAARPARPESRRHDDASWKRTPASATIDTYIALVQKNQFHREVTFALGSEGAATDEEFARLKALRQKAESHPPMRANLIKLFEDGVMEYPSQSAAMLEPYLENGKPGKNLGPLYHEKEPLTAFVQRAAKEGFGMHIHVIGDRAARVALDAFEAAAQRAARSPYSLTHLELVDPQDLPRFKQLDVIASMQLQWGAAGQLQRRCRASLHRARASGAPVSCEVAAGRGCDAGRRQRLECLDVQSVRSHRHRDVPQEPEAAASESRWRQTRRCRCSRCSLAYTMNAARMLGREKEVGSLEAGKDADFIVLDRRLHRLEVRAATSFGHQGGLHLHRRREQIGPAG